MTEVYIGGAPVVLPCVLQWQDIMTRNQRMRGRPTLWLPGTGARCRELCGAAVWAACLAAPCLLPGMPRQTPFPSPPFPQRPRASHPFIHIADHTTWAGATQIVVEKQS